jgi:hypothetical protein
MGFGVWTLGRHPEEFSVRFPRRAVAVGAALVFMLAGSVSYAFAASTITKASSGGWYTCSHDGHANVEDYMDVRDNGGQPMCIGSYNFGDNFTVKSSSVNRYWADFPNIYRGCEQDGNLPQLCTSGYTPLQASSIKKDVSSVSYSMPKGFVGNSAYDIWFNKKGGTPSGHDNGAEVMIWLGARGMAPGYTNKVYIDGIWWGYDTWNSGVNTSAPWHYIRFWRLSNNAGGKVSLNLIPFFTYAERAGRLSSSWYLTGTEYGFETCKDGAGLTVQSYIDDLVGPPPLLGKLKNK